MKDEGNSGLSNEDFHPSSFILHPSSATWRVFCAIEFPAAVSLRATEHIKRLREQFPDSSASWNRDGKFHLTLKFIGEMPQTSVARLSLAAQRATANLSSFNLIVAGAGAFPKKGSPKVLWLGIDDPTGQLAILQTRLEQECAGKSLGKEERSFHPHLTLARVRRQQSALELADYHKEMGFPAVEAPVSELLVIRSELSSQGSKYSPISQHALTPQYPLPKGGECHVPI